MTERAASEIPYAHSLGKLRQLLDVVRAHKTLNAAAGAVSLKARFKSYAAESAEALGLARRSGERLKLTALGQELTRTEVKSAEEAAVWRRAFEGAASIMKVAPDLLAQNGPSRDDLVQRLENAGMTGSMAEQRGEALARARKYILQAESQLTITRPMAETAKARYEGHAVLRSLKISNFKAFGGDQERPQAKLDAPALTVLAGPNGAGKSTVLQALNVLGALVRGNITQLLEAHAWDYADLPHLLSNRQTINLRVDVEVGPSVLRWSLTLGARRHPGIAEELVHTRRREHLDWTPLLERRGRKVTLFRESTGEKVSPPAITLPQSWLGTIDPESSEDIKAFPGLVALRRWAEGIRPFWSLDPTLLRTASRAQASHVGPHGGDLASFLFRLNRRNPKRFAAFVRRVAVHYPRLVDITPKSGKEGLKYLSITERWNREKASFNAKQVSDGLLRLLAVASIPDWEIVPSLILLDEVENGLHPRMIGGIASLLEEVSSKSQVIATTHSPITLNYIPAASIRLVTRGRHGTVQITPLPETNGYEQLRAQLDPGELWYNVGEERLVNTPSARKETKKTRAR